MSCNKKECHCHGGGECGCESHSHEHTDGCGCGHSHGKENKFPLLKYCLGAIPVIIAFLPFIPEPIRIIASLIAYAVFGVGVWRDMVRGFFDKKIFTEFTLMCVASAGAFAIGEYADAAAVMYLYSLGEALSDSAYSRSKRSISELMEIAPEYVNVIRDGESVRVSPEDAAVGEVFIVLSGERVALDGVVVEGNADADTSSVTGEALPLSLYSGLSCPSGAVLLNGSVKLRAVNTYKNSVVSKLTRAVEDASKRKAAAEKKISSFARVFTPIAFFAAIAVALIGSIITKDVTAWIRAGIGVLVVSCPCSLVLSVPLTYFAGIGSAATRGIVFKGGEVMDSLKNASAVAFDKTGTLTELELTFDGIEIFGNTDKNEVLSIARSALAFSSHPTAISFCASYSSAETHKIENAENIGGRGLVCSVDGERALFGNAALMRENGIEIEDSRKTAVFMALGGDLVGSLDFSSHIKPETSKAMDKLRKMGIRRMAVISGDGEDAVREVASALNIEEYYHSVMPDKKAHILDKIQKEQRKKEGKGRTVYVGDGLNDSAVIAMADIGIAMGDSGAALTAESADMVLMDGRIDKLPMAIEISKRTSRIATQNIVISLGIKLFVMAAGIALSAVGLKVPLELAIIADVGAALVAVLNAVRASERKINVGRTKEK